MVCNVSRSGWGCRGKEGLVQLPPPNARCVAILVFGFPNERGPDSQLCLQITSDRFLFSVHVEAGYCRFSDVGGIFSAHAQVLSSLFCIMRSPWIKCQPCPLGSLHERKNTLAPCSGQNRTAQVSNLQFPFSRQAAGVVSSFATDHPVFPLSQVWFSQVKEYRVRKMG